MNRSGGIRAVVLALTLTFCSPALAHFTKFIKLDDFQRKPGTNMGPNWRENHLDFSIAQADGTNNVAKARDHAFMTYVGNLDDDDQELSATTDWFAVTVMHGPGRARQYAGLVLRYADRADCVLVALQDNNRDGLFDHILLSRGISTHGLRDKEVDRGKKWFSITPIDPVREVTMRARIADDDDFSHPGMLQVIVQLDGNHNGICGEPQDDTLVRGNLNPAGLGTGVGLAGTGGAELDDFGGYKLIPEPATLAMLILGGLAFRRRLHCPSR